MFIVKRTFINFFRFPFVRFGQWFFSNRESSSRLVVLVYFIVLYPLLGIRFFLKKKITAFEVLLFLFVASYTLFAFLLSHQIRFFLPAVITLPLLLIVLTDRLRGAVEEWWSKERYARALKTFRVLAGAFAIFVFLGNFHYFHVKYFYLIGTYGRKGYIEEIGGQ